MSLGRQGLIRCFCHDLWSQAGCSMVQSMVVGGLGGPKAVDPARSDLLLCWARYARTG